MMGRVSRLVNHLFVKRSSSCRVVSLFVPMVCAGSALAQPGTVLTHQKISDTDGGFQGTLHDFDEFGKSSAASADIDGDLVQDLIVGAFWDDDGSAGPCNDPIHDCNRGAVWVLFLNEDGTVESHQKISDTEGSFTGGLDDGDVFGGSVAALGDLDGDDVIDLAVGASGDDDGGLVSGGAVWVLFLNSDGSVKSHQKISSTEGGFGGELDDYDFFGNALAPLGDFDGDGVADVAVGAVGDNDGGGEFSIGAVWVLFLNPDGTVKAQQKISATEGGFSGNLDVADRFGIALASLGDLDGDRVDDLAVGASGDGDRRGAVWVLFLNPDATVKSHQKISDTEGNFTGTLDDSDFFGVSVTGLGDLDGDGVGDLAVGASGDDDGGNGRGAVWILFLNPDGTVASDQKISDTEGGFSGGLDDSDSFGNSVVGLGDLDGDGIGDLAVGASRDDDGGRARGAVWVLFLDGVSECPWDLDGSGKVSTADLLNLLGQWGSDPGGPPDFNGDGNVGMSDLELLLGNWGPCP